MGVIPKGKKCINGKKKIQCVISWETIKCNDSFIKACMSQCKPALGSDSTLYNPRCIWDKNYYSFGLSYCAQSLSYNDRLHRAMHLYWQRWSLKIDYLNAIMHPSLLTDDLLDSWWKWQMIYDAVGIIGISNCIQGESWVKGLYCLDFYPAVGVMGGVPVQSISMIQMGLTNDRLLSVIWHIKSN